VEGINLKGGRESEDVEVERKERKGFVDWRRERWREGREQRRRVGRRCRRWVRTPRSGE